VPIPAYPHVVAVTSIAEPVVYDSPGALVIRLGSATMATWDVWRPKASAVRRRRHEPQLLRLVDLLDRASGDEIVFLRDASVGDITAYSIVDPVLVRHAWDLLLPIRELERQEEELARRPNELGRLTGEYARDMIALANRRPTGMTMEDFNVALEKSDDNDGGLHSIFWRDMALLRAQKRALAAARERLGKDQEEQIAALKALYAEEQQLAKASLGEARMLLEGAFTGGSAKPIGR
jgi:hypothetical protein